MNNQIELSDKVEFQEGNRTIRGRVKEIDGDRVLIRTRKGKLYSEFLKDVKLVGKAKYESVGQKVEFKHIRHVDYCYRESIFSTIAYVPMSVEGFKTLVKESLNKFNVSTMIQIGLAQKHPKDQVDKAIGRHIAAGRLDFKIFNINSIQMDNVCVRMELKGDEEDTRLYLEYNPRRNRIEVTNYYVV